MKLLQPYYVDVFEHTSCITLSMYYDLISVYGHFSQELPVFISSWIWSSRNQWILIKLCFRMFSSFLLLTLIELISIPLKGSLLVKKYSMDYIMETFLKQVFPYQLPSYAPEIVSVIEKWQIHKETLFGSCLFSLPYREDEMSIVPKACCSVMSEPKPHTEFLLLLFLRSSDQE